MDKISALLSLIRQVVCKDAAGIITGYLLRADAEKVRDWIESLEVYAPEQHSFLACPYDLACCICSLETTLRYIDSPECARFFFRRIDETSTYKWRIQQRPRFHIHCDSTWIDIDVLLIWVKREIESQRESSDNIVIAIKAALDDW